MEILNLYLLNILKSNEILSGNSVRSVLKIVYYSDIFKDFGQFKKLCFH